MSDLYCWYKAQSSLLLNIDLQFHQQLYYSSKIFESNLLPCNASPSLLDQKAFLIFMIANNTQ